MSMRGRPLSRCAKCCYYCRTGTTFLFSHIGLCGLVVGYSIMGAFTFEALESKNEEAKRLEMIKKRIELIESLWTLTKIDSDVLDESNWTSHVADALRDFELALVKAARKEGYDGNDDAALQWTFTGALLYSIIVITTIGYGNIAPKTGEGKVVTIFYAIVGIPLMLLCLSNIGDAMAQSFKFIYWKVCCFFCIKPRRPRRARSYHNRQHSNSRFSSSRSPMSRSPMSPSRTPPSRVDSGTSSFVTAPENDSYMQRTPSTSPASPSSPTSPLSPGLGSPTSPLSPALPSTISRRGAMDMTFSDHIDASKVPIISNKYVLQSGEDIPLDLPPPSLGREENSLNHCYMVGLPIIHEPLGSSWENRDVNNVCDNVETDEGSESDESDDELEEDVSVPIWLCLGIVGGYICGGAILFMYWESWSFLDSSYFCFVTLTTIGFGDLVPGSAVLSEDSQVTLGICALYLLFGMALLAMSFNLVQEEVTKSVKYVGRRIGILADDDN